MRGEGAHEDVPGHDGLEVDEREGEGRDAEDLRIAWLAAAAVWCRNERGLFVTRGHGAATLLSHKSQKLTCFVTTKGPNLTSLTSGAEDIAAALAIANDEAGTGRDLARRNGDL